MSIFIFHGNFEQLTSIINEFNSRKSLLLFDVRNTTELGRFLVEVTRLLHNYVASAMTLVDHTRILVRELYNGSEFSEFNNEYNAEIESKFQLNPLHQFVQGLRNYIVHKGLPIVGGNLDPNKIETYLIINFAELRDDFKWNKLAKEFISSRVEDEKLEIIVSDYCKLVSEFHEWFYKRQLAIQAEKFKEANKLRERIANSKWTPKFE